MEATKQSAYNLHGITMDEKWKVGQMVKHKINGDKMMVLEELENNMVRARFFNHKEYADTMWGTDTFYNFELEDGR